MRLRILPLLLVPMLLGTDYILMDNGTASWRAPITGCDPGTGKLVWDSVARAFTCGADVGSESSLIFSDDFEDGTLDAWDNVAAANTSSTTHAHGGTKAVKYDSSQNNSGGLAKYFPAGYQQMYVVFWWYPTANFTAGSGAHFWRFGSDENLTRQIDVQRAGNTSNEFVGFWLNSGQLYPITGGGTMSSVNLNAWNEVKLFVKLNDPGVSNGELRVWLNGVEQITDAAILWRDNSLNIKAFMLNTNYDAATMTWWFDDVQIYDAIP